MTSGLIKRGYLVREAERSHPHEDWENSDVPIKQGMPNTASKPPEATRKKQEPPYSFRREHGLADTLILDF